MQEILNTYDNIPNKTKEFEKTFQDWFDNKHDIVRWLKLSKYLAIMIDNQIPLALELRDLCIKEFT